MSSDHRSSKQAGAWAGPGPGAVSSGLASDVGWCGQRGGAFISIGNESFVFLLVCRQAGARLNSLLVSSFGLAVDCCSAEKAAISFGLEAGSAWPMRLSGFPAAEQRGEKIRPSNHCCSKALRHLLQSCAGGHGLQELQKVWCSSPLDPPSRALFGASAA